MQTTTGMTSTRTVDYAVFTAHVDDDGHRAPWVLHGEYASLEVARVQAHRALAAGQAAVINRTVRERGRFVVEQQVGLYAEDEPRCHCPESTVWSGRVSNGRYEGGTVEMRTCRTCHASLSRVVS